MMNTIRCQQLITRRVKIKRIQNNNNYDQNSNRWNVLLNIFDSWNCQQRQQLTSTTQYCIHQRRRRIVQSTNDYIAIVINNYKEQSQIRPLSLTVKRSYASSSSPSPSSVTSNVLENVIDATNTISSTTNMTNSTGSTNTTIHNYNNTTFTTRSKNHNSTTVLPNHRSQEDDMDIQLLNRHHYHVGKVPVRVDRIKDTATSTNDFKSLEDRELQKLQRQQLYEKHYLACQTILQFSLEQQQQQLLLPQRDDSLSDIHNYKSSYGYQDSTMTNQTITMMNNTNNYSPIVQSITSYTHSYHRLVNHLRYFGDDSSIKGQDSAILNNGISLPQYHTISVTAMNRIFDLLLYIIQQKIHNEKNRLQHKVQLQHTNDSTSNDNHDSNDDLLVSKNDTMWMYNPGILYNPLIQLWKHMTLSPQFQPVQHGVTNITNTVVTNPIGDGYTLRTAQQVLEHLHCMIRQSIEYTYYTNRSMIIHTKKKDKMQPKKVPYKLFYNSTTFNMILEVLMIQHEPKVPINNISSKKKKKAGKNSSSTQYHYKPFELTAAVMQSSFTYMNDEIRKCIQQYLPTPPEPPKTIAVLEEIVKNYPEHQFELYKQQMEFPEPPPKNQIWYDDIEDANIILEEKKLREAKQRGQLDYDERGKPIILDVVKDEDDDPNVQYTYTSINPTTQQDVDTIGLGIVFRPDVNTFNLFMKTWATKCTHNVPYAAQQIYRIYNYMQQEGMELAPTKETYNTMLQFYSSHPTEFVHKTEHIIQYLVEKHGIRNVQSLHWYYAIVTYTSAQKHKMKAREYLDNMINSSHHHVFNPNQKAEDYKNYKNVQIIADTDDDIQAIALIQRAALLIMNMYRKEVQHHIDVIHHTKKYVTDKKQGPTAFANSNRAIDVALKCAFDLYTQLKEQGFLEFTNEELDTDGYLKYRDEIRSTFMETFAYSGDMDNAKKIFDRIIRTNISQYVSLIDAYGKHNNIDEAEVIYQRLIQNPTIVQLNLDVYTTLMNGYANSTKYDPVDLVKKILNVFRRVESEPKCSEYGIRHDLQSYNSLLYNLYDVYQRNDHDDRRFVEAVKILNEMDKIGRTESIHVGQPTTTPNINTYLKVVQIGLKVQDFDGVLEIIERMAMTPISEASPTRRFLNSDSSHSIFHMYREVNSFEALDRMIDLLNLLNSWADQGLTVLRPTAGTYSVFFKMCSSLDKIDPSKSRQMMEKLYQQMKDSKFKPNVSTFTELIEYYSQSSYRDDLDFASDLLLELEARDDPTMRSDKRLYHAVFYGYLKNVGDIASAVQVLFRYMKGYIGYKIKDRPSSLLHKDVILSYMEADELVKAVLFVDQIHIMQKDEPLREDVKGVTIQLDKYSIPHHLGPDLVVIDKLMKAVQDSKSMDKSDKVFYKNLLLKHLNAVKRFHRKRIRIKKNTFKILKSSTP